MHDATEMLLLHMPHAEPEPAPSPFPRCVMFLQVARSVAARAVAMSDTMVATGMSEEEMADGEDWTAAVIELAGDVAERPPLAPVKTHVNAMAMQAALEQWRIHPKDVGSAQVRRHPWLPCTPVCVPPALSLWQCGERCALGWSLRVSADAFCFQTHVFSSPSCAQVQIARLSERIKYLTEHQIKNKKDKHTERGLVKLANRRRKLLKFLIDEDLEVFEKISAAYGIRTRKIVEESLGVATRERSRTKGAMN